MKKNFGDLHTAFAYSKKKDFGLLPGQAAVDKLGRGISVRG